jgi:hypothetical protein
MARRAKRNSNKRDRQSLARETVDLALETDMKPKWQTLWETQGFNQKKIDDAHKAMKWIKAALDMPRCACRVDNEDSIVFIHETYGPYTNDYDERFKKFAWASNQFCADGVWSCNTPFGKFTVILEYFDNHCTGY